MRSGDRDAPGADERTVDGSRTGSGVGRSVDGSGVDRPETDAGTGEDADGGSAVDVDSDPEVVLADRYRRYVVEYLDSTDGAVSVVTLARHVAARSTDKPPDVISLDEHKQMYSALQRSHLPKLARSGLVEYDRADDAVALADR